MDFKVGDNVSYWNSQLDCFKVAKVHSICKTTCNISDCDIILIENLGVLYKKHSYELNLHEQNNHPLTKIFK